MKCPRRGESAMGMKYPGEDSFAASDRTCSYCGSLDPDEFMRRLEAGDVKLSPTDKNYKVYVVNDGGAAFKQTYRDCYNQCPGGKPTCTGPVDCTHWVTRETSQTKFYFKHLSTEQKQRFVELLNTKRLKLEYPGYFYNLPYFCVRA